MNVPPPESETSPDEFLDEARRLVEQGQLADAERALLRAVRDHPERTDLLSHLGYFYAKQQRNRRALAPLLKRARMDPPDAGVNRLLAELYQRLGDWPNSRLWLRRAREIEGHADARRVEAFLYWAQARSGFRRELHSLVRGNALLNGFARHYRSTLVCAAWAGCRWLERFHPPCGDVGGDAESFHLSRYLAWLLRAPGDFPMEAIPYHKCREALFASRWLPIADENACILDLGSGKNPLPVYWAHRGCEVTALDGSPYGFSVLRSLASSCERGRETRIRFCQGDVTQLPFADGAFDAVSCICMLEHIPEEGDIAAMHEMFRVLRSGGVAVITVESAERPGERWLEVPYEIGYQRDAPDSSSEEFDEVFCRDYSPTQLRERLIASEAWEVLAEMYFDDATLPWRRWLDPMRGSLLAALLAPLQPLLSFAFYRKAMPSHRLTPSSIGCVVMRKP